MKTLECFSRFLLRFRYPVTLPEDIAKDLGIDVPNSIKFEELIRKLTSPECCPGNFKKYMRRADAEKAFNGAQRKERFMQISLFSYYFNEGWVEFKLEFDNESLLRRMYIQHKIIQNERGFELHLSNV